MTWRCRRPGRRCATSPSSSTVPTEKRYGIAIYTDNGYDALVMGYENVLFGYGGELGDYSTYKVAGLSSTARTAIDALKFYKELYKFTPPGWGKVFFLEDNQAITEGLAAMSMNFFAFFPALTNPATNKNAKVHRLLRQSGRARPASASRRSAARASRSSSTRRSRPRR